MTSGANRLPRQLLAALTFGPMAVLVLFYLVPIGALAGRFFTIEVVRSLVHDRTLRRVLWFTTWQATVSTFLTVAIGLVPAYILARFEFRGHRLVMALVTVPFVLPTVVVGAAFLALLPDGLDHSVWAVLIAHVFFNVAVVVRGVCGLWEQLPVDLAAAARTLGASPWQAIRHITLPLLAPVLYASASIVFLFTFTSFGVVRILGGPSHPTLEVEIWQRATRLGDIGAAAVLSVLQLILLAVAVVWFARLQRHHRHSLGLRPLAPRVQARTSRQRVSVIGVVTAISFAVALPLVALFERSLRTGNGYSFAAWRAVFGSAAKAARPAAASSIDTVGALSTSLVFASVAMLISVFIGGCASLAIVALGQFGQLLDVGLMLPLATSAVTIGFGLLITFDTAPLDWRDAPLMIPLGHALVAIPFVVRITVPVLRSISPQLRSAANSLGASPLRAWAEIDLRFAVRPLATGAGFALAISLGEFGATSFLTRQGRETLPIAIEQLLNRPGALLHAQGYVLATILAALTLSVLAGVAGFESSGAKYA